jgi:hypothetical protein
MIRPGYRRAARALILAIALVTLAGCSRRAAVQGTVTLAGAPVDGGSIRFTPAGGGTGAAAPLAAPIQGGKYAIDGSPAPSPGSYRVEISWKKKTGRKVPTPGDSAVPMDETAEAIPPNYNSSSTLTADVKSGSNTLNFDLKSR